MKMDKIASSGNDEFYTPEYAITPLVKYLKEKKYTKIWCPFDKDQSLYVKVLKDEGFIVKNTHLEYNQDFFSCDLDCDCIVSNPPYSLKYEVLSRLFELKKPFAMLLGVAGLFESKKRFDMFKKNDFEVMYFNKRISYFKSYEDKKTSLNPPFSSVYITKNLLPSNIVFEVLNK